MIKKNLLINILVFIIGIITFTYISRMLGIVIIALLAILSGSPVVLMVLGNSAYRKGQNEKALKFYKRAANNLLSSAKIKISYGYFLIKSGYVDEADELLKKMLQKELSKDDEMRLKSTYGIVLWKRGKIDDAVEMLTKFGEDYKSISLYENLGYFLILQGDYEKALEFNKEAIEYDDSDAGILDNLALNYYFLGDHEKALEIYEKFINRYPELVTAYYFYSLLLIENKEYDKALEFLNRALSCRFSFISLIQKEEIENKISEIEKLN